MKPITNVSASLPEPKKKYTYDDFLGEVESSGLSGSFSDADMALAERNPEAGKKILGYKIDYNNATTEEGRTVANEAANAVRREAGEYHGGNDGLGTVPYFEEEEKSPYQKRIDELMNSREKFTYDPSKDKKLEAFRKEYEEAGDRASSDTLARIAAASGGRISTAAARAAGEVAADYASGFASKAAQLEDDAYSRWLSKQQLKEQELARLINLENNRYQREFNERQYNDNKEYRERVYNDSRIDEADNDAYRDRTFNESINNAEFNNRWNVAYSRAQFGDYTQLNAITEELFGSGVDVNEVAKNINTLLEQGYTWEEIMAIAGK